MGVRGVLWAFVLSARWSAQRGHSEPRRGHRTPLPKLTNHLRAGFLPRVLGLGMDRPPAAQGQHNQLPSVRPGLEPVPLLLTLQPRPRAGGLHLAWYPVEYVTSHTAGTCQTRLQLKAHI